MPTVRKPVSFKQIICNKKPMHAGPLRRLLFETEKMRSPVRLSSWDQPRSLPAPARTHWRKSIQNLWARSHQNNICVFGLQSVFLAEQREREKNKENTHRTEHKEMSMQAAAHTAQACRREKRATRRQHQHRFCSHRSAGNYDNNVFPRQPLSDLVSEHLPFLKSPPDNIWYDYKVKILFKERPLTCV